MGFCGSGNREEGVFVFELDGSEALKGRMEYKELGDWDAVNQGALMLKWG